MGGYFTGFDIIYFCHSFFTIVRSNSIQQFNGMQMFRCGNRERQNIADSLVKTGVGSATIAHRLVLVLQVILDVPHLMVYSKELLHRYCGTLLDPKEYEFPCIIKFINKTSNETGNKLSVAMTLLTTLINFT